MPDASPFWNAYKTFVKDRLLPGVPVPQDQAIFAQSFSDPLTSATTALSSENANYLVYGLANTTLATDGSKGAYDNDLKVYLNTVDESTLTDPKAKQELEAAESALVEAQNNFTEVEKDARKRWGRLPEPKPTFEAWASGDPIYTQAKADVRLAQGARDQAYNRYHGKIDILRRYQEQVRKALDENTSYPSYNMAVEHESTSGFKPAYSASGLRDQLNRWIEGSAGLIDRTMFEVKIDSGTPTSTQTSADSGIYLKFTTKDVASFSLKAEEWNVPGVKTLYPKRVAGAPDVLNPKYALPVSVLVAYGPRLDVELRESSGSTTLSSTSTTQIADDKPYIAVLGILGQHFPAK
ncbi:hypothetical protein D9757_007534 [Collybiopsis confluens]|uniref:Uncharacterized protein n=1 Tax=Collybiopsis confluens TaxID=2823264 RepID=A0A8H5HEM1_9AGAR|nr:hypothetical protein D9757_007534 [Collybiopsis confluens]